MNFIEYLKTVYIKWKFAYYFTFIFFTGILTSAFIVGQSVSPFYVFSMYSYSFSSSNVLKTSSYRLVINNHTFNTYVLLKGKGDNLRENINRYIYLKNNKYKDKYYNKLYEKFGTKIPKFIYSSILSYSNTDNLFKKWLIEYLTKELNIKIYSLRIYEVTYLFNDNNKPKKENEILKLNYNAGEE